jgi:hypothetical protein
VPNAPIGCRASQLTNISSRRAELFARASIIQYCGGGKAEHINYEGAYAYAYMLIQRDYYSQEAHYYKSSNPNSLFTNNSSPFVSSHTTLTNHAQLHHVPPLPLHLLHIPYSSHLPPCLLQHVSLSFLCLLLHPLTLPRTPPRLPLLPPL